MDTYLLRIIVSYRHMKQHRYRYRFLYGGNAALHPLRAVLFNLPTLRAVSIKLLKIVL